MVCVNRPLDVDAAGPDDDWYVENGYWDEEDEDDEFPPDRVEVDTYNIAERATVARLDGQPVVVTGGARYDFSIGDDSDTSGGIVRAWDLVDGRPIAVTGGHDDFLQAWDIPTGEQIGKPLTGIKAAARAIEITKMDERAVVVAGGDDTMLHVWDLATQEPIGSPLAGHTDRIETLGTATVGGRTIAITGSYDGRSGDGTTRVWDLASGEQIGDPLTGHHLQMVTQVAGTPVAVTAGDDDSIRLLDLTLAVR